MSIQENAALTREELDGYEKRVWQIERRQAKALAGLIAGWTAGSILFLLVGFGAIFSVQVLSGLIQYSPLRFFGPVWKGICVAAGLSRTVADTELFVAWSLLAAVLGALTLDLIVSTLVRLIWPSPAFVLTEGEGPDRAEALYRRCQAAVRAPVFQTRRISLIASAVYACLVVLPIVFAKDMRQKLLEELGALASFGVTAFVICAVMVLFLFFYYLIYRGMSGAAHFYVYYLLRVLHHDDVLEETLRAYVQPEEDATEPEPAEPQLDEEQLRARQAERDRQRGDQLYRQAIAGREPDEDLIEQAADLGSRPACLYVGRMLMEEWSSGDYTEEEKRDILETAQSYLSTACLEEDFERSRMEARFLYLSATVPTMSGSAAMWRSVLDELRGIRASGQLPERYAQACSTLIYIVTETMEAAQAQTSS